MAWYGYLFSYSSKVLIFVIIFLHCSTPGNTNICGEGNTCLIETETIASYKRSNGNTLYLYQTNSSFNWCGAYQQCRIRESNLIVILDNITQSDVSQLVMNVNIISDALAWISAKRKDYGNGWTWVNDSLTDCTYNSSYPPGFRFDCSASSSGVEEYGRLLLEIDKNQQTIDAESPLSQFRYTCRIKDGVTTSSDASRGWYDAQNECNRRGGRLASYDEATIVNGGLYFCWNGLQYRPWIWTSETRNRTLYYSNWYGSNRSPVGQDCLSLYLDNNAQWKENECSATLGYFICEADTTPVVTDTTEGNHQTTSTTTLLPTDLLTNRDVFILVACIGAALIIINITVAIIYLRRKEGEKEVRTEKHQVNPIPLTEDTTPEVLSPPISPVPVVNHYDEIQYYNTSQAPSQIDIGEYLTTST